MSELLLYFRRMVSIALGNAKLMFHVLLAGTFDCMYDILNQSLRDFLINIKTLFVTYVINFMKFI